MIAVGQLWALKWAFRHRMDVVIVDMNANYILGDSDHRCKPYCDLLRDQPATLTLSGRRLFLPDQFVTMFDLVPEGAIPLAEEHSHRFQADGSSRCGLLL